MPDLLVTTKLLGVPPVVTPLEGSSLKRMLVKDILHINLCQISTKIPQKR